MLKGRFFDKILTLGRSKKILEANSKIRLLEDLYNLVVSVCAKFEGCNAKSVGGVGFLRVTSFSKKALLPKFASQLPVWWYRLQTLQTC